MREIAAAVRAHRDQHRIESLLAQIGDREVSSRGVIQLESDIAGLKNLAHLRFHHIARQAVFRNSQVQHAARDRSSFEDRDRIAHQREIMRGRESHRAAADNRDFVRELFLPASFIDVDGMLRLRAILLGEKTLQRADGNGPIDLAAAAGSFARMRADPPADAGQRIRVARQPVCFFKAALGNQAHVASGVGVCRAGHHAGKVGVQPIPVDFFVFESLQHWRSCLPGSG